MTGGGTNRNTPRVRVRDRPGARRALFAGISVRRRRRRRRFSALLRTRRAPSPRIRTCEGLRARAAFYALNIRAHFNAGDTPRSRKSDFRPAAARLFKVFLLSLRPPRTHTHTYVHTRTLHTVAHTHTHMLYTVAHTHTRSGHLLFTSQARVGRHTTSTCARVRFASVSIFWAKKNLFNDPATQ